ncbi:cupin domain-containing protein [Haloferax profundi]|uniref:Cupin n=1 Tax=Haloferax profundi TaxID=1544718 RepID=A0A0W1SV36_9EURY|nr:cupin domain-containing protein [Haloferax profundi]KTG30303.1 cupin [Haloferax profundi]
MSKRTAVKSIRLDELELVRATQAGSGMDVRVNFPFSQSFPAATGVELEGRHNVVYFELDPGQKLGTHVDSPEEIIVCLDGSDVEVWVGESTGAIQSGTLTVIPPMTPHGFHNTGTETARFLGFFSDRTTVSEFETPVEPLGVTVLET